MVRISFLSGLLTVLLLGPHAAMAEHWASEAIPFNKSAGCMEGPLAWRDLDGGSRRSVGLRMSGQRHGHSGLLDAK